MENINSKDADFDSVEKSGATMLRAFSVKSIDTEKRQITAVASSEIIDRDDEIVSLAALKKAAKEYMKNPVILAGHSHRLNDGKSPVVGKVISYEFKGHDFLITVEFADTELGNEYWKLYRDKFQRAFSIGFRGLEFQDETHNGKRVRVFKAIELFEISCVAVGANPAALSKAKSFVLKKKIEREKRNLLDDPDRLEKLFTKYELLSAEYGDMFGDIPGDSPLWDQFTAGEKALLLDLEENSWGFDDEDCFYGDFSDTLDDNVEDYPKSFIGDSGAFDDEIEFAADFGSADSEPDYF